MRVDRLASAVLLLTSINACSDDTSGTTTTADPAACAAGFRGAGYERFPVGETLHLQPQDPACAGDITLVSRAEGSDNEVVSRQGGARFTVDAPGSYEFALGDARLAITATAAVGRPHHNYNYYPTRSLALVDGELWVANGMVPSISRLNPDTLEPVGTIEVGGWPVALGWVQGMAEAVVVHRASDSLGFVDTASGRLVDSVWVGDEPSNVVVSPDGALAYVALQTRGAIAEVDLATHEVVRTVDVGRDLLGLAIHPDGTALYAAAHRSGHPVRFPFGDDPAEEERDIVVIDAATLDVTRTLVNVGTTIKWLEVSADGSELIAGQLSNDTVVDLAGDESRSFVQSATKYDLGGDSITTVDLTRQQSSGGPVATVHAVVPWNDGIWVVSEGYDEVLELDAGLAEQKRIAVGGRPRHALATDEALFVHGVQAFTVTRIDTDGSAQTSEPVAQDPRTADEAFGQRYFTGAGRDFATTWTCNSCHADGLMDTLIWNAGPFDDRVTVRPFFWLEGTYPLGWAGYLSNVKNYAYVVNRNVGIVPTTEEAIGLGRYIASIMPPPPANDWTERDGSLSEAGLRGKELYEGKALCASCHGLPLGTSRGRVTDGPSDGKIADIPSLVGAYRFGVWLKHGQARSLRDAVAGMVDYSGVSLTDAELDDLTRYTQELTARDFFMLTSLLAGPSDAVAVDKPITLVFSAPPHDSADNLARLSLKDATGTNVEVSASVEGRRVHVTAVAPLTPGQSYTLEIPEGFEALDERAVGRAATVALTTASEPAFELSGAFLMTTGVPSRKADGSGLDPDNPVPFEVQASFVPTASGADLTLHLTDDLEWTGHAVLDGDTLHMPPLPVPAGPGGWADGVPLSTTMADADGDGVADTAADTLTMQGPGFEIDGIRWQLSAIQDRCSAPGPGGDFGVEVTAVGDSLQVSWDNGAGSLGVYIVGPTVTVPLGPWDPSITDTLWVVTTESFPDTFEGPVDFGVIPEGAVQQTDDAVMPEPGQCFKVQVITSSPEDGFQVADRVLIWE